MADVNRSGRPNAASWLSVLPVIATLGCHGPPPPGAPTSPTVAPAGLDAFVGRWQVVREARYGELHSEDLFDFELRREGNGLRFRDLGRMPTVGEPAPVTWSPDGHVHAAWQQLMPFVLHLDAHLVEDNRVLEAKLSGLGLAGRGELTLRLTRTPPALRPYFAPRLTAAGARERTYAYARPAELAGSWPVATPEDTGLARAPLEALVRDVLGERDGIADRHTEAVLVLRHGTLVLEEYFWGARRELARPIASCTKSVASMLAGIAWDAGKLGLDELATARFPEYAERRWAREHQRIRVRDLLSMTAGVAWTDRSAADAYTQRFFAEEDPLGFVLDLPRREPPGERFNYNNGLPALLGPLLARATGEQVDQLADRALFEPLGIRNYAWATLRDGTALLNGGMRMPARELAKLGQLMLDGGTWRGQRLLSAAWVALSTQRQTRSDDYPYGFYWHLSDPAHPWRGEPPSYLGPLDRQRAFMALGQGGQALVVLPDADVVIVILSSNWQPHMADAFPTALINRYVIPAIEP